MNAFMFFLEIETLHVGLQFEKAPLHCTLMPCFKTDASADEIERYVKTVCRDYHPITMVADREEFFGPERRIRVHSLKPNRDLSDLHLQLYDGLKTFNVQYEECQYCGPGYRMHVSACGKRAFSPGCVKTVEGVYLIQALNAERPDTKRVISKISFG